MVCRTLAMVGLLSIGCLVCGSPATVSGQEKKTATDKQLEVMEKVRAIVEKGAKPAPAADRGPAGKLDGPASNVCGKEYTAGEAVDKGISVG